MVIGCRLVREGHSGGEALQEIEERWQHKAVMDLPLSGTTFPGSTGTQGANLVRKPFDTVKCLVERTGYI